jgi:hypothetical protein
MMMTKYDVTWVRRVYAGGTVQIEAESAREAEVIALGRMSKIVWSEKAFSDDPGFKDDLQSFWDDEEIIDVRESEGNLSESEA